MIINKKFIKENITNNGENPVPYCYTHGATDEYMGDGIGVQPIYYPKIHFLDQIFTRDSLKKHMKLDGFWLILLN